MPEDRTPRITAPTEPVPDAAEMLSSRRWAHDETDSRTSEHEKRETHGRKRQSTVDMDGPAETDVEGQGDHPDGEDRVHFPLFP